MNFRTKMKPNVCLQDHFYNFKYNFSEKKKSLIRIYETCTTYSSKQYCLLTSKKKTCYTSFTCASKILKLYH